MNKKNMLVPFLLWGASLYFKEWSLKKPAAGKYTPWMSPCKVIVISGALRVLPRGVKYLPFVRTESLPECVSFPLEVLLNGCIQIRKPCDV